MAETSSIEWTDATWNPVTGCSVVSPGCTNCYAMKLAGTRLQHHVSRAGLTRETKAGPVWTGEVRLNEQWLTQPLQWRRPRRIFVCAHGDLFHESVPDGWIDRVFAVMALAPQHTFQVLTKRAERMRRYFERYDAAHDDNCADFIANAARKAGATLMMCREARERVLDDWPMPNVWLGVSVEDQARAKERIPHLMAAPAAVRFLSCEPLLGPMDLGVAWHGENALDSECWGDCNWCRNGADFPPLHNCQAHRQSEADYEKARTGIDWVILGGESGPGARPMHPDWARSLRDQCAEAGVPFFFKQWGEWAEAHQAGAVGSHWLSDDGRLTPAFEALPAPTDIMVRNVGKKGAGRLLDGAEHNGMPA